MVGRGTSGRLTASDLWVLPKVSGPAGGVGGTRGTAMAVGGRAPGPWCPRVCMTGANTTVPPITPGLWVEPIPGPLGFIKGWSCVGFKAGPTVPGFMGVGPGERGPVERRFFARVGGEKREGVGRIVEPAAGTFFAPVLSPAGPGGVMPIDIPGPTVIVEIRVAAMLAPLSTE